MRFLGRKLRKIILVVIKEMESTVSPVDAFRERQAFTSYCDAGDPQREKYRDSELRSE
jgi:hypothetical protein